MNRNKNGGLKLAPKASGRPAQIRKSPSSKPFISDSGFRIVIEFPTSNLLNLGKKETRILLYDYDNETPARVIKKFYILGEHALRNMYYFARFRNEGDIG